MIERNFNKYDIFIFLLIISLAFGGYGGLFRIHRVLSVLLLPELFVKSSKCINAVKSYYLFFIFFSLYCFFSLLWTPSLSDAYTYYFAYCFFDFLIFIQIIVFSFYANKIFTTISWSWLIAVSFTLIIAFWEIITENHLSLAKQDSDYFKNAIFIRRYACVTFYNLNTYVTYLCFALPFIFLISSYYKKWPKIISIIIIILSIIAILFNASRGGLISVIIMMIVYLLLTRRSRKSLLPITMLLVFGFILVTNVLDNTIYFISDKFDARGVFGDEERFSIWGDALKLISASFGLGVGIGGSEIAMSKVSYSGVIAPHNIFIEIMLNAGVLFALIFIFFLLKMVMISFSMRDKNVKTTLLIALFSLPISSIINSTYLNNAFVFCALACLVIFKSSESNSLLKLQNKKYK